MRKERDTYREAARDARRQDVEDEVLNSPRMHSASQMPCLWPEFARGSKASEVCIWRRFIIKVAAYTPNKYKYFRLSTVAISDTSLRLFSLSGFSFQRGLH
jgi:hypothetical protein